MSDRVSQGVHMVVLLGVFSMGFLVPVEVRLPFALALGVITGLAVWRKEWPCIHLGVLSTLATAASGVTFLARAWPGPLLVALGIYGVVLAAVEPLRRSVRWWRLGSLGREAVAWILLAAGVSTASLVVWKALVHPDLADVFAMIPRVSFPLIVLGALAFSMVNALAEEAVFRGVMQQAMSALGWPAALVVVLQGASFGVMHIHGFPRGAIGIGLASVYGMMMGFIRYRTGGMLAPWVAHLLTDIGIVAIVALSA